MAAFIVCSQTRLVQAKFNWINGLNTKIITTTSER